MKNFMIICVLCLLGAASGFAQSNIVTVTNNGNCAVIVQLVNEQDDCNKSCTTTAVCVLPYSSVKIKPCNKNWYWDRAIVYDAIDACDPCTSTPVMVSSPAPTNCLGLSNPVTTNHCAGCGPFTVDFSSLTTLDIY